MHASHDSSWVFPLCPTPPDWRLDWEAIQQAFPWVAAMADCPQDPLWHAEGNVQIHTRMVCEALLEMRRWRALNPTERSIVFVAALMHDVAKPQVTCEQEGRIRAPRHAAKGAAMARALMLQQWLPATSLHHLQIREQIAALIRYHGLPLHALDRQSPQRELWTVSQLARCDWLALVALADVLGRQCPDQAELIDRIELFREFAEENHCLQSPRRFASDHTRLVYFQGRELDPDCEVFDDTRCEVILMSGLPGAGKDHWLQQHAPTSPVISLDAIRQEMRVAPTAAQGQVIQQAKQRARDMLRQQVSFVWNATNTSRNLRRQLIALMLDYHARVRIVYLEPSWQEIQQRNRERTQQVPHDVLVKLIHKLEPPTPVEAHRVEMFCTSTSTH